MSAQKDELNELALRAAKGDRVALEQVLEAIRDDIYGLSLRTLGTRSDAEDATQEILIQVMTSLGGFRGDASLRTWSWRIAARALVKRRKSQREELITFEAIEGLIARGEGLSSEPDGFSQGELLLLAEEVRVGCTQGMLLSLDRDHRLAYVLGEIFELEGEVAAAILDVSSDTFRKRLQRGRERLATWMHKNCGLANIDNACRCARQIQVAMGVGLINRDDPEYAAHPAHPARPERASKFTVRAAGHLDAVQTAADIFRSHPRYQSPDSVRNTLRELIASRNFKLLEH